MEGPFGKLKSDDGLGGGACQAFGTAANTIAATAAIVAYNLKLGLNNGHDDNDTDPLIDPDDPASPNDTNDTGDTGGEHLTGQAEQRRRAPP